MKKLCEPIRRQFIQCRPLGLSNSESHALYGLWSALNASFIPVQLERRAMSCFRLLRAVLLGRLSYSHRDVVVERIHKLLKLLNDCKEGGINYDTQRTVHLWA